MRCCLAGAPEARSALRDRHPVQNHCLPACCWPILCAVAGDAADVVRSASAGLVCSPEDPAALAVTVRELHAMPAKRRESVGATGRRAFLANHTRAVLVKRYEALLTDVTTYHKKRDSCLWTRLYLSHINRSCRTIGHLNS
jgi:glycosyltransferase involved in cell wall biosynthesis